MFYHDTTFYGRTLRQENQLKRTFGLICLSALIFLPFSSYSQEIRTIEVTGNGFPEEAAYMDARENALKQAGVRLLSVFSEIQSGSNIQVSTSRQAFLTAISKGLIIEEDTIQPALLLPGDKTGNKPLYGTKLRVKIKNIESEDPYFHLKTNLIPKRSSFRDGESFSLEISATLECYVTIFSIGADNKLYLVFPNTNQRNNHLKAQTPVRIDNLVMGLLPGLSNASEAIIAVATKENFPFINFEDNSQWKNQRTDDGQYIAFRLIEAATKLGEWLSVLNENQWTIDRLPYTISK